MAYRRTSRSGWAIRQDPCREATHQVIILRPYFANVGKRLVKTPKVYFTDTGVLCYLTGLKDPAHAASGPLAGTIVETAVVIEVAKAYWHRGQEPRLWFWRTATGEEVDLFVETAGGLVAVEAKATATPTPPMAQGIVRARGLVSAITSPGYLVHLGDAELPLGPGCSRCRCECGERTHDQREADGPKGLRDRVAPLCPPGYSAQLSFQAGGATNVRGRGGVSVRMVPG